MPDKSICEKLLLKPGREISFLNTPDSFRDHAGILPPFAKITDSFENADVILLFVRNLKEISEQFTKIHMNLNENIIFWVGYPKKSGKITSDLDRDYLNIYLNTLGWQGVSLISLDETWSAMRVKRK